MPKASTYLTSCLVVALMALHGNAELRGKNQILARTQRQKDELTRSSQDLRTTLDKNAMGSERLDKMPLVKDALRGFMRDDVWVYNGEVFRMAARPVFDGGRYVGAIVHGMAVSDDLARRLGSKLPKASPDEELASVLTLATQFPASASRHLELPVFPHG